MTSPDGTGDPDGIGDNAGTAPRSSADPGAHRASLRNAVHRMLDEHWVEPGYAAPNEATYPWQWLWDSCFHSLIWAELGEGERALTELATMFGPQDDAGFVTHDIHRKR